MTIIAVVDTNVVVSGMLASGRDSRGSDPPNAESSPNARILDAMMAGELRFILSDDLLEEYRAVLLRPAIVARHRLTEAEVDLVLEAVVVNAGWREPVCEHARTPRSVSAPAPEPQPTTGRHLPAAAGDAHIVALLEAEPAAVLATGDRRLREAVSTQRTVLRPAELAATLAL